LAASVRAAPRTLPDFDLAPIAPSCYGLGFSVTTIAAALLILVKKTVSYPWMPAAPPCTRRTRHRGRLRLKTAHCLICVTPRGRDLRSADEIELGAAICPRRRTKLREIALIIRNKPLRRSLGALLVLLGASLIWLPYDLASGIVLVFAGAALELAGIALEKGDNQA